MNVALKSYDTSGALEGKSTSIVLAAGIPSLPRKQEEIASQSTLPKPEPSPAQRALIELRSLHGQKHAAVNFIHLKRSTTTTGGRTITRDGSVHSLRRKRPFKTGPLLADGSTTRNLYPNDTVKHLMHQLSELNNITYGKIVKGGNESFCSEMTLQARREEGLESGILVAQGNGHTTKPEAGSNNKRPHNVMKLIERQILRDLTRHINRSGGNKEKVRKPDESPDTKTHSEELPGGMKVVIKKTARRDEHGAKMSRSGDVNSRKSDVILPSINKTAPASMRRRRHEKFEWLLDESKSGNKAVLPSMSGVAVQGQSASQTAEPVITEPTSRKQKSHTHMHGDGIHPSLPQIQEEPDTLSLTTRDYDEEKMMHDVGTSVSPPNIIVKDPSPTTSESPENGKVKLPILGKSIGQHKELNYENGSKFIKPSIGEIKRIIHGLYGDYFDFTLDRYYTYEKQLNETKPAPTESDTPLHFVTPAWDESESPAASHTLQLFQSGSKRFDEPQNKSQSHKMSVPLIRSKYGKTIASINKNTEKATERHHRAVQASERMAHSQPVTRNGSDTLGDMDYAAFIRERMPPYQSITPNTPNERALRGHIAYQVALYRAQIARENRSLEQTNFSNAKEGQEARYVTDERDSKTSVAEFSEDIDRYAQYLEAYLDAKHKNSQERRAKLRELKQRHKEKKYERNKHLEIVEQRDRFLAQIAKANFQGNPKTPKTPANTISAREDSVGNVRFEYIQDERFQQTPITKMRTEEDGEPSDTKQEKQAMGTKIYRIFGERKKSASAIRRWVAQAPLPYTSRAIKRQVTGSSKGTKKTLVLPRPIHMRQRVAHKPRIMTDLVSRFQVATRYKLDREYVASLASGTM